MCTQAARLSYPFSVSSSAHGSTKPRRRAPPSAAPARRRADQATRRMPALDRTCDVAVVQARHTAGRVDVILGRRRIESRGRRSAPRVSTYGWAAGSIYPVSSILAITEARRRIQLVVDK